MPFLRLGLGEWRRSPVVTSRPLSGLAGRFPTPYQEWEPAGEGPPRDFLFFWLFPHKQASSAPVHPPDADWNRDASGRTLGMEAVLFACPGS